MCKFAGLQFFKKNIRTTFFIEHLWTAASETDFVENIWNFGVAIKQPKNRI